MGFYYKQQNDSWQSWSSQARALLNSNFFWPSEWLSRCGWVRVMIAGPNSIKTGLWGGRREHLGALSSKMVYFCSQSKRHCCHHLRVFLTIHKSFSWLTLFISWMPFCSSLLIQREFHICCTSRWVMESYRVLWQEEDKAI